MTYSYKPQTKLDKLEYNPAENPLIKGLNVPIKTKKSVRTSISMPNLDTGECQSSNIYTVKKLDESQFVKVFSEGIKASFDLTRTAHRVFQLILDEYENEPMTGGYVDAIQLAWFNGGLSGQTVGMHRRTFNRGLAELLDKGFLAPKSPNTYWVNPALFFKGDRVLFINEFQLSRTKKLANNE